MSSVEVVDVPFTINVGGGWGKAGADYEVKFSKEPVEAYVWIESEGMEPPFAGASRVYVDGVTVTEWERLIKIPARQRYTITVEKTGFGWIGGFTCSGYIRGVFERRWYEPKPKGEAKERGSFMELFSQFWWVFLIGGLGLILILIIVLLKVR